MTKTLLGSSLLAVRLLMLTLGAALTVTACGTAASDAADPSLTAENGTAAGLGCKCCDPGALRLSRCDASGGHDAAVVADKLDGV